MPQKNPQTVELSTGRRVEIVPLPYAAWEEMESGRLDALERLGALEAEGKRKEADLAALRLLRNLDLGLVKARVTKWGELREQITADEYCELVNKLTQRSAREAEPENLSAGGDGSQTPAGAGSAPPVAAAPSAGESPSTAGAAPTPSP